MFGNFYLWIIKFRINCPHLFTFANTGVGGWWVEVARPHISCKLSMLSRSPKFQSRANSRHDGHGRHRKTHTHHNITYLNVLNKILPDSRASPPSASRSPNKDKKLKGFPSRDLFWPLWILITISLGVQYFSYLKCSFGEIFLHLYAWTFLPHHST